MRFLMICMKFPVGEGQSYLTTELADALVEAGHEVEALVLDWAAKAGAQPEVSVTASGVRVVRCSPRFWQRMGVTVRHASKFVLSGRELARAAKQHMDLGRFDAAIAWMPAIAIAPVLPLLETEGVKRKILFIWDFFPDHYREIGRIPAGLAFRAARAWEHRLLRHFSAIVCTLPGNADYLRRHYPVRHDQRVLVTPVWCTASLPASVDRHAVRRRYSLPADHPIAVFGGQLVAGRGFDQMLAAAKVSALMFLFVGDGPLAATIRARAAEHHNVIWLPPVTREAYLELLGACDVGMVATVPGVTSFSIPSKTLDYLRAGLPVVAAVEQGNDYAGILREYGVGTAVPFNDPEAFRRAAERLATDPEARKQTRQAAPRCLDEVFDVRHAVSTVLKAVEPALHENVA